jgi:hypothetical protein
MGADADAHLPIEERCQAKWDKTPALRKEFSSFNTYLAYSKAVEKGQVRVLSK